MENFTGKNIKEENAFGEHFNGVPNLNLPGMCILIKITDFKIN